MVSPLRHLLLIALVMLALPGIAAAQDESDTLVVYSGRSDKFVEPVMEAFTRDTGIEVTLHNASSTALLNKLRIEGRRTAADVYLSNDAGNLQLGSELDLFAPVKERFARHIPRNFRAADNTWIGLSARARVLVVNSEKPPTHPISSVFDLAAPRLAGRLGITTSSNESFIAGTTVYMVAAGRDKTRSWLQGLKDNTRGEVFNKHSRIVSAVAEGKKEVGLVNHYYVFRHLAKAPDAPLRLVLPDQGESGMGVALNVAGVAVSRHTQKHALVDELMAFLTSQQGQKIFAEVNYEYPTRPGVPAAADVPPLDSYKIADVPMGQLGRLRDETLDLLQAVGLP